jgi:hypothetical protein
MKKFRALSKALLLCLAILLGLTAAAQADSFIVYEGDSLTDVSRFGNLSQQHQIILNEYGNYGCQVTAYVNALVYLQKAYPSIYGTSLLSGYSADTLATAAVTLGRADYMNVYVTKDSNGNITGAGSRFRDQVWGVYNYIEAQAPDRTDYGAQMIPVPDMKDGYPLGGWTQARPQPIWVSKGNAYPTEAFLYNALSNSQGLVICWNELYPNGQLNLSGASHLLTVTGLTWDSITKKGTLYFIDPSVGTQRYSSFRQVGDGSLWLDYGEDADHTPWKKSTGENWWYSGDVRITLALAEGPAVPLPSTLLLLGSGLLGLAGIGQRLRKS